MFLFEIVYNLFLIYSKWFIESRDSKLVFENLFFLLRSGLNEESENAECKSSLSLSYTIAITNFLNTNCFNSSPYF